MPCLIHANRVDLLNPLSQMAISMGTRRRSMYKFGALYAPVLTRHGVYRYVAKVIFTYILGYKVDVGHMEAVNLISSPKYSEKQIVSIRRHAVHVYLLKLLRRAISR